MNKVILKSISLKNFKGIAQAEFTFDDIETTIKGENGSGKTTIKNAFEWLLCQNVADVLPTLNNKEIPNLTTSVSATMVINDYNYLFERESKGKYTLNKETGKMNKTTNESTYKIDGLEYKEKDYKEKIANLLSNSGFENLQILTDKEHFNTDSTKFKWTDRRKLLFEMCGVKNAVNTIIEKPEYSCIREYVVKGHATSDIKSMLKKNKNGLKDQQTKNNILIEQKISENTEIAKINFEQVEKELQEAKAKLNELITSSKEENHSIQITELQNKVFELTKEKAMLENADLNEQANIRKEMQEAYNESQNIKFQYTLEKDKYASLSAQKKPLTAEECPFCHNKLKQDQIDTANKEIETFNKDIDLKLQMAQKNMEEYKDKYNAKKNKFEEIKTKLAEFKQNERIKELNDMILATTTTLKQAKDTELNKLSSERQKGLETQISGLEREMAKKAYFNENETLIQKWKNENKSVADLIVGIEQKETALEKYVKEQTDIIIDTVNSKFSNGVSWALYKETYKAGEGGIEEDCVCMYNGKRYSSLSTGEKAVANMIVLETLQNYYGVNLPVFYEDAESTSIKFCTDRQIIRLFMDENSKLDGVVKITDMFKGE